MKKNIRLFVLASVLLNVLLIGVLIGQVPGRLDPGPRDNIRNLVETAEISEERRAALKAEADEMSKQNEALRRRIDDLRAQAIEILSAEQFDAAAHQRLVGQLLVLRNEQRERLAKWLVTLASELNQHDRQELAKILRSSSRHRAKGSESNVKQTDSQS